MCSFVIVCRKYGVDFFGIALTHDVNILTTMIYGERLSTASMIFGFALKYGVDSFGSHGNVVSIFCVQGFMKSA